MDSNRFTSQWVANQAVQRTGASRFAQSKYERHRRLAPVADLSVRRRMTIDDFASITRRIIERDGFDGYLPTLCLPSRRHIAVLEGVPDEQQKEIRRIALAWAADKAKADEEFLLAFKEDADHFRVIRRFRGQDEEQVFRVE